MENIKYRNKENPIENQTYFDDNSALTNDNVYIIPAPVNEEFGYTYDWVLYQENPNEPVYAYLRGYPDGMQPDDEVELCLIAYFDGDDK